MDDFPGLLSRDFGFRAQGKAAPMAASKGTAGGTLNFGIGSGSDGRSSSFTSSSRGKSSWNSTPGGNSFLDDESLFRSSGSHKSPDFDVLGSHNDVYGGPPKYTNQSDSLKTNTSFDYDAIFQGTKDSSGAKSSSLPVYDKPVYDDDIFDGVPGMKSTSSVNYDDVFSTISSPPKQQYDDLLGNLGKKEPPKSNHSFHKKTEVNTDVSGFDDLIPGFGSSPSKSRGTRESSKPHQSTAPSNKSTSILEDPFVIIEPSSIPGYKTSEVFSDSLEHINEQNKPETTKMDSSSGSGAFDDVNPLDDLVKSVPSYSSGLKSRVEDKNSLRTGSNATSNRTMAGEEPAEEPFFTSAKSVAPKVEVSPKSEANVGTADDVWITVSEVPLFTQPTSAPPPSRPPPPRPVEVSKVDQGPLSSRNGKEKVNQFSSFQHFSPSYQSPTTVPSSGRGKGVSSIDELEDFAMGRSQDHTDDHADVLSSEEEVDTNSAAAASTAAMKEAMDRAEAKFKHAREVRERESARTGRNKEATQEKDEKDFREAQERERREKQERLEREREQREREEKDRLDRERRRLEKEREQARQVMERATREARERAAAEARERAAAEARQKAQKAAVEKATAEARERAERAAVQRAQVEARERAAAEAKERAERAAAEARERSNAEAREKAAAAAREHQQKNEHDLESFFSMGTRASSAPRPNRSTTSETAFDTQFQNRPAPEVTRRTSGTSSSIRKASSTTNIVDDLTSIFGGAPPSGQFQDIDGESEERRRARLERHQRTQERAAKALAEKNERDRQTQRDQAERHRIAETLDIEIKRWSAGKEGNLRALLSTLQYVLWPECGWQPVSLTDLITGASVKKVYRKATLCIHPDKVQQKGANLQQKYIAEKVFDLLKEAWNKFNSEELF